MALAFSMQAEISTTVINRRNRKTLNISNYASLSIRQETNDKIHWSPDLFLALSFL